MKPLLALDESKPFDPEKATEIKAKLAEMQKAQYNTKVIGGKSKEFHKAFKDAEVDDIPWDRSLKSTLKEGYELTLTTVDAWWKYMKTLPKIVYDPKLDPPLLKLVKQEQGHRMYRNVLQKALDRSKSAGVTMNTLLKKTEAAELARMKELSPIAATENPLEQLRRAQELLYVSAEIKEILGNEFPLSILPVDVQDRALWLAMHKGLDEAREYLSDDKKNFEKFLITDADKLEYQRFEGSKKNAAINSGRDVLTPLHQAGVHVLPHALDLLATLPHGKERVMLAVSSARVSRWMLDPAAAHPALNAILIVSPGLKGTAKDKAQAKRDAIVEAFCTQKDVPGVMTAAQATKFVQDVQKHLEFQNFDAQRSPALNEKKERFGNPLDILKAGGKELKKMLRSNNKVEKALAITMIVAAGFFLWQTWKKKGLGQKLMLGIPLFFGADILVKRMTGKGVLDRLGMRYMNEEDRSTSVEQFVRRNKKERNYAVLDTDPGRAAIQALMSTEKPIPVDCLLTWRKNSGAAPDYRTTAPEILQGAAQDVVAKMGSYTKSNTSPDANEQEAYRILYTAFDALCANVAADNVDVDASMTNPKAERGADLIERRYVLFNEDYMVVAGFDDELRAAANSRGGYTMLDVLVFERQTPAMKEAMYDNDELLEWMYRGTGVSLDFIRDGLTKGWVHTQILAEWGKRKGLLVLENGLSFASEKAKGFYEWLQVTYPKLTFQLKEDWLAAYNMVSGTLSSAGIYLKEYGDDAVEWTIDFSIATGKFTIDTAQNIHRELQKIGLTGEPIEWFDSICLSIFGFTMSEYILYKDSIEDTPAKRDAHVEALASDEKLFGLPAEGEKLAKKSDLEKQLEPISTGVNSVWIQTAFKDVTGDLFGDKEKDLDAYEKLAVNEL
ncbi:MAG TPA: hypothetical protein VI873_01120, partial [Candidatus Peribacteraceae bacterium]|nr:hypothetical protein [Candidatus Peribacteraceae bacterium]